MKSYIQSNKGEKYNKVLAILFITAIILMILGGVYLDHKNKIIDRDYEFSGRVDDVSYDVKGKASVIIKGIHYDLSDPDWDFDHNRIANGDYLIKKKNSMVIKLIRTNGQSLILGNK